MPNPDTRYGLTNGPDLYLCNGDGVQNKILKLDDAGNILLDGARIGDSWVPILSQVASASSSIDFTSGIDGTYDRYPIVIERLRVATDASDLWMRVSTDGGSTWKSGASDYRHQAWGAHSNGATTEDNRSNAAAQMVFNHSALSNTAAETFSGVLYLHSPSDAASSTGLSGLASWVFSNNSRRCVGIIGAEYIATTAVDAFQVLASADNLTSGRVTLYGEMYQ